MLFSFKYLKRKEDFSRINRLLITWITQVFIGTGIVLAFIAANNYFNKSAVWLIIIGAILPFMLGVLGAAVAYWLFTLSRHRASMRLLLLTGVKICLFIYLGLPVAAVLLGLFVFIVGRW
ncbi:MAG: hypothetical protein ACYS8W_17770 [Planctomycetota bacterium]